jgi:NAD(P)-dependent dehydrogenase (short-subunit alcohol dehydrogenase family)
MIKSFPSDLADKSVLVVGGSTGVGLETALRFADAGCRRIAIAGRNAERGLKAAALVRDRNRGAESLYVRTDANEPSQAIAAVEQVESTFGRIDVLVTSTASAFLPRLLNDTPIEDIPRILAEQALGPLLMSRAVLPGMRARRDGVIVNIASDAAKSATQGETVIGAAMAAIVMFSRALAMEAKRDGVRVNVLTPSLITGTPIYDRLMQDEFSANLFGKAAKMAHLGVVEPSDLAEMILFLASSAGEKITGQAISINGGISAA